MKQCSSAMREIKAQERKMREDLQQMEKDEERFAEKK